MKSDHLLRLWRAYADATALSMGGVGHLAGLHDKLHRRLAAGLGAHSATLERAADWFASNWPEDHPWPSGIPHPHRPCCGAEIPAPAYRDDAANAGARRSPTRGRG